MSVFRRKQPAALFSTTKISPSGILESRPLSRGTRCCWAIHPPCECPAPPEPLAPTLRPSTRRCPHGLASGPKRAPLERASAAWHMCRLQTCSHRRKGVTAQLRVFYLLSENRIRQVSVHDLEITSAGIRTQRFRCHSQLHNSMPCLSHAAPFRLVSASLMTKRAFSRATSLARPAAFTESSTASKSL